MILVGKIVYKMEKVQDHTLYFINMVQLNIAPISQDQLLNKVQKAGTMNNELKE